MSKISTMMDIGKRSMMNSQTALQTVAHNIANKTTEGYSRQRVELQSSPSVGEGNLRIGTGSKAAAVSRVNNPYLEKQIQKEGGQSGYLGSRADALSHVEQVYNEQGTKGLNQYLSDFFNSYRELSNYPESTATRTLVRESAEALAKDFNRISNQLTEVQNDIDIQMKTQVEEINQMSREIADLNQKIASVELQQVPANDERDRRDLLLKKLNEKIDISWAEGDGGQVTVMAAKSALLVSGFNNYELKVAQDVEEQKNQIYFFNPVASSAVRITEHITGGSLGGAINVRDQVIDEAKTNLDLMAFVFSKEVNTVHREGYDLHSRKGLDLFEVGNTTKGLAGSIKLNKVIALDANRIVSGIKPNAPADNTVANVISALQERPILGRGTATFDDFYNSQVGQIGILAQRAQKADEAQKNILEQITKMRESISGVSLDEEATRMIEYQKAFEASARLIRTADEMFDTVLNLKRL